VDQLLIAGVSPGGLKEGYAVRIFICYIYRTLNACLSREDIIEIFSVDGQVDYFTLTTAFAKLIEDGHLLPEEGSERYQLSKLGEETADNLYTAIPPALRGQVLRRGYEHLERKRKDNEVSTCVVPHGSGYHVQCSIHEGDLEFLNVSFFAPTETQAEKIAKRFYERSQEIYTTLLEQLVD